MNLVDQILAEYSKKQRDKIVKYIGNDEKRFAQLIDIFLKGPYRVTQRAAWPISYCVEKSPHLLAPHLKKILILLGNNTIDDPVKRNILRMLQFIIIPKAHQGITSNLCFGFLSQHKEPIAVRVFSMTVMANLVREVPDLKNELIPLIEDQLPYASAGFHSRAIKILKELKK